MKKYLLMAALASPLICVAQINVDTIPKKVNALEIHTGLTAEENYNVVVNYLISKDWPLDKLIKDHGYVSTGKVYTKPLYTYFRFWTQDKKIRITGTATYDNVALGDFAIENGGDKGSPAKKSFQSLVDAGQAIAPPNSKITFSIVK